MHFRSYIARNPSNLIVGPTRRIYARNLRVQIDVPSLTTILLPALFLAGVILCGGCRLSLRLLGSWRLGSGSELASTRLCGSLGRIRLRSAALRLLGCWGLRVFRCGRMRL